MSQTFIPRKDAALEESITTFQHKLKNSVFILKKRLG